MAEQTLQFPEECRFSESDEWAKVDGPVVRVGVSDYAQAELSDVVFVEVPEIGTRVEAGLERFLAFGKGFIGEDAVARARDSGVVVRLVGLVLEGRGVPRAGFPIITEGARGVVTSGSYGPSVERSIAMGYVSAEFAGPGTRLLVEIRGRAVPCEVVEMPFYSRKG